MAWLDHDSMTHDHMQRTRPLNLSVDLDHAPTLNFAMEQAGVPIVSAVHVTNSGAEPIEGAELVVTIAPDIAEPSAHRLGRLRPGESVDLGALDIRLTPGRLRALREAERAQLSWKVVAGGETLASGGGPVEVLAFNEWAGLRAPPALLATFVTPNAPEVAGVLARVQKRLHDTTGDGALTGYQEREPRRVRAMVQALYEVIPTFGLGYVGTPASFEEVGQKVRLIDVVLAERMGNCLDVTLFVASCVEQMGLSPLLVIQRGHAFPGVWLVDDRHHDGVVYDAARLRNAVKLGTNLFFDSSTAVHDPPVPFESAVAVADESLEEDAKLLCAIDVPVARRDRYRPLPLRDGPVPLPGAATMARKELTGEGAAGGPRAAPGSKREPVAQAALTPTDLRLKQWRDKLLDLSLRNKLLNFRKDTKSALPLAVPDVARFEDLLASSTPEFSILPKPEFDARDQRDQKLAKARVHDGDLFVEVRADLDKRILHSPLDDARLTKQATGLAREARTALEEGGANVLYVAIGFLKWFEAEASETERLAPLLLVPVSLEYMRATRRVTLRRLAEEPIANQTLIEKMARDFGLDLASLANLEPDESGVDVPLLLRNVREAIQQAKRWEVLDEAHIGLFQFTKFLMWKDLEENKGALLESRVVRHIASGTNAPFPDPHRGAQVPPERLDDAIHPANLPLVMDADSTQTAAIHAALVGRSFVLQGPPGTGKSQTITNLIAAAMAHGKTVLFVSEKMAALDVVQRRLQSAGLGDFCLELHSHKAQKKQVLQSLERVLDRASRTQQSEWQERSKELAAMRAQLNAYERSIHAPTPLGSSFYQGSARLLALQGAPDVRLVVPNVLQTTRQQRDSWLEAASAFAVAAATVEPVANHPFREAAVEGWSAQADRDARYALQAGIDAVDAVSEAATAILQLLGVSELLSMSELRSVGELCASVASGPLPPGWRDEGAWRGLHDRLGQWSSTRDRYHAERVDLSSRWTDAMLDPALAALEPLFVRWANAFFLLAWWFLRRPRKELGLLAKGLLPPSPQIARDLGRAKTVREMGEWLQGEEQGLRRHVSPCWTTDVPAELHAVLSRGDALRAHERRLDVAATISPRGVAMRAIKERVLAFSSPDCPEGARRDLVASSHRFTEQLGAMDRALLEVQRALAVPNKVWPPDGPTHLADARQRLTYWLERMDSYRPWCAYRRYARELHGAGLGAFVDAHRDGKLEAGKVRAAVERALLSLWTDAARDAQPVLRDFDGANHHRLIEQFRKADGEHAGLASAHIVTTLEAGLPKTADAAASSEPGILRNELRKKARHKALRRLLGEIPNLLSRLKPCVLMSPLSVAQYLPAKGRKFDIVVFDEASQIGPHDAIGAIARGEQVVIVGDSKQLPPTSFFQRTFDEEAARDEEGGEDMESILDQALAASMPEQMLGWHYRSRHETLIEFSNAHYYENRLHVFPAARGRVDDLGVKFHHIVNGVYDAGRSRQNEVEARAIVDQLVSAMRRVGPTERSFGVVTFSSAQQELVEDLLAAAREKVPAIEPHFADEHPKHEPVFVKNLENVQGDERDEILFSIGYGPDSAGRMAMNFGPLNRDGGERRLNVAVTRARAQLRLFASFTHDRIDTNRTRSKGAAHLKAFLRFATERSRPLTAITDEASGDFDSDFERAVFDVLRAAGHRVHTQVGCGGYKIDLAVAHPKREGVFALGVECDGAAYHSGATARDRDRLRQQVLEGLGWKLHRIWSTDWAYERTREIDRLMNAVEVACRAAPDAEHTPSHPKPQPLPAAAPPSRVESARAGASAPPRESAPEVLPYQMADLPLFGAGIEECYESRNDRQLGELIALVASTEAPVHLDEVCRRVGAAFGGGRVTERLRRRVAGALQRVPTHALVDEFVWERSADRAGWRVFRGPRAGEDARSAETIAPEEVAAAARWVLSQGFSMTTADLWRETARVFGIQRVGGKVEERMRAGVRILAERGECVESDDRVSLKVGR